MALTRNCPKCTPPDFRHCNIPHFRNVDVYPLLCKLLKIEPATNDGDLNEIKMMLEE